MIYLDHNATCPLDPRVLEAMLPYLQAKWGSAESRDHAFGWDASDAVEAARIHVADLINAKQNEIIFTSGATESLSIALQGIFAARDQVTTGILTSNVEHEAVIAPCMALARKGVPLTYLQVNSAGQMDLSDLETALNVHPTKIVCLVAANNETGTVFPFRECAAIAHDHKALFLTDATQALGKLPLDTQRDDFDLAAFSGHKINGPKGVGALYIRGGPDESVLSPIVPGGGQEKGLRGGTLNVPAIVGFGEACRISSMEMKEEILRVRLLRNHLEFQLTGKIPGLVINGDKSNRLHNTSSLCFPGVGARLLIRDMDTIAVSSRSACSSGSSDPSHVLKAMGLSDEDAFASIRFSLGRITTREEIDQTIAICVDSYQRLRAAFTQP